MGVSLLGTTTDTSRAIERALEAAGSSGGTKLGWSVLRNPEMASLQDGQWHHLVLTAPESGTMEDTQPAL